MKVASAACKKYFVTLGQEKGGCSEGRVLDVDGCEEWVGCWMGCGLDMVEVEH